MQKGLIIQARLGSKRLPAKICLRLGKTSVIEEILKRSKHIKADCFVLALSKIEQEQNQILDLSELAKKYSYEVYYGSDQNLLNRYYEAAKKNKIDVVARLTSDCPLFDPNIYNYLFEVQKKNGFGYVCNNAQPTLPIGFDAEVITIETLTNLKTKVLLNKYDKEHVTTYIKKSDKLGFYKAQVKFAKQYSKSIILNNRYTLDYPKDYDFFKQCWSLFKNHPPNCYAELIDKINKSGINSINNSIKDNRFKYDTSKFEQILVSYP